MLRHIYRRRGDLPGEGSSEKNKKRENRGRIYTPLTVDKQKSGKTSSTKKKEPGDHDTTCIPLFSEGKGAARNKHK